MDQGNELGSQPQSDIESKKEQERLRVAMQQRYKENAAEAPKKAEADTSSEISQEDLRKMFNEQQKILKQMQEQQERDQKERVRREMSHFYDFIGSQPDKYPTLVESKLGHLAFEDILSKGVTSKEAADHWEDVLFEEKKKEFQTLTKYEKYKSIQSNSNYFGPSTPAPTTNSYSNPYGTPTRSYQQANHSLPENVRPTNRGGIGEIPGFNTEERSGADILADILNTGKR